MFELVDVIVNNFVPAEQPLRCTAPALAVAREIPRVCNSPEGRELALAQWWLIPFWSKTPVIDRETFNARGETAEAYSGRVWGGARTGAASAGS